MSFKSFLEDYDTSGDTFDILKEYIDSKQFQKDLESLTIEELETISKRSTIHSNDFKKIVLSTHNGYKLRLHIWNKKNVNQYHEPHNHRWDFKSYVLTGTMVNRIVGEVCTNKTFLKCKSLPMVVGQNRTYEIDKEIGIMTKVDQIIKKGEVYTMEADTIHIAKIPKNTLTATLFVTSPAEKEFSDLYMPDLKLPPSELCLEPFTSESLKQTITDLIEVM